MELQDLMCTLLGLGLALVPTLLFMLLVLSFRKGMYTLPHHCMLGIHNFLFDLIKTEFKILFES
jgi:hypothetical protein